MMPDCMIHEWAASGGVSPFDPALINPASVDLRLGNKIRVPQWYWRPFLWRIAHKRNLSRWSDIYSFDTYLLPPRGFVLCHSVEFVKIPPDMLAVLFSKSSTGRVGLEHLHAGLGDPGFCGQWTWEFFNVASWPILLEAGKRLMQMVLIRLIATPEKTYEKTGRYQGQTGPTEAREK